MAAEDYNPVSVPSFLTDAVGVMKSTALITAPLQLQRCCDEC